MRKCSTAKENGMNKKNKKNRKKENILIFHVKCFFESVRVTPVMVCLFYLLAIFEGASYGFFALAFDRFFTSVSAYIDGAAIFTEIVISLVTLVGLIVLAHITNAAFNTCMIGAREKLKGFFIEKVNHKAQKIHPIAYENPATLDDINKAVNGAGATYNSVEMSVFTVCNFLPYYTIMFLYLFNLDRILPIALLFVFLPVIFSHSVKSKVYGKLEDTVAPLRREYSHYLDCMGEKEIRVLGGFTYFRARVTESIKIFNKENWGAQKKGELFDALMSLITLCGYGVVLFLFTSSLVTGNISVAAFAALFTSINSMFQYLSYALDTSISNVSRNMGLVKNYMRFCNLEEREGSQQPILPEFGIQVRNVSFLYPNTDFSAVNNINLDIQTGEIIAIVGENGSGKSTLVKLLAGLYTPTHGEINIFGRDTNKESAETLYQGVSSVFQNFQKYKMTLRENIEISSLENKREKEDFINLVAQSGIDINNRGLPNGYETVLSRDFDGVDLSLGQWQRVAIARGIYKEHILIFLDEPTAAIDPIEESGLFKQFVQLSKGKTAIIVTHRLGSAKIANRIVVMNKGHIAEIGSHHELMKKAGIYHDLYQKQAKWYNA